MVDMFNGATAFNQDISGWNTGAVTNMESMFYFAQAFGGYPYNQQDISGWNVGAVSRCFFFSDYSGLLAASPPETQLPLLQSWDIHFLVLPGR